MDKSSVPSSMLEERVAMYLQAIEYATAANDNARREALEKDIQTLMDLMEQVSMGRVVTADRMPPPVHVHSHAGEPLANPLGELSSRLADYHKALYYADIEIGENRTQQIQTLQRGLQVIQKLQEKAQAGYPIRVEEIPPPVTIPTDDEFVVDPKSVITERIALYYQAIEIAEDEGKKTRVQTLQTGIQKLDYLLKRAESNVPIYKKDLPCSPALGNKFRKQTEQYRTTVELLTKMSGLSARAAKLASARGDTQLEGQLKHNAKMLTQVLHDYEMGKPLDMSSCPYTLADIERLADQAGVPASQHIQDSEMVRLRCNQYRLAALKAKRSGHTDTALQHMRVVKGLQSLVHAVEKGQTIDMTQVPPAPSEQTPTTEKAAQVLTQKPPDSVMEVVDFEKQVIPDAEMDGINLAEELSAFLHESPSSDEGGSQSESSGYSSEKNPPPAASMPKAFASRAHPERQPNQTHPVPKTSSALSGLNPLYALTQTAPNAPQSLPVQTLPPSIGLMQQPAHMPQQQQKHLGQPLAPGEIPSRALKPLMNLNSSGLPSEQGSYKSVNGFHGSGVILEPIRPNELAPPGERRRKGDTPEHQGEGRQLIVQKNGAPEFSSEMTCIEILKYEKMQLDKEESNDAKVAAEKLGQQMENEKQRLRVGGYEAWLAYLGQVEEDVTNINCDMKLAREGGEDDRLASLIIKKELAERELAVMRKRLPELQT